MAKGTSVNLDTYGIHEEDLAEAAKLLNQKRARQAKRKAKLDAMEPKELEAYKAKKKMAPIKREQEKRKAMGDKAYEKLQEEKRAKAKARKKANKLVP